MRHNFIISASYRLADLFGSIPLSGRFQSDRLSRIPSWTYLDALARASVGLLCVGSLMLLPRTLMVFGTVGIVAIVLLVNKPKELVYISISYLTFRYFYCSDLNLDLAATYSLPWKFMSESSTFIWNADKWVTLALFISLVNMAIVQRRPFGLISRQIRGINKAAGLFVIISIISALANGISPDRIFFFLQLYLRPILFMFLFIRISWTETELRNFFLYILILMFPLQIVLSLVENIPKVLQGNFMLFDRFTGTFTFPFNYLCVQLLLYSFLYVLALFLLNRKKKYILAMLLISVSVYSASSGFQTFVFVISTSLIILWIGFNSNKLHIPAQFARFLALAGLLIFISGVVYLYLKPDVLTKYGQGGFPSFAIEKYKNLPIAENPKIKIYKITSDLLSSGTINPLWGNGPTNYLSGASKKYGNPYLEQYGTEGLLGIIGEYTGMPSYVENDVVGIAGEVGITGLIIYLYMFIAPVIFVKRNMGTVAGTMWHAVAIASIATTVFMMFFGAVHVVLGNFILPIIPILLTSISIKAIEMAKQSTISTMSED